MATVGSEVKFKFGTKATYNDLASKDLLITVGKLRIFKASSSSSGVSKRDIF